MANKVHDKDDIKKSTKQVAFEVLISARCRLLDSFLILMPIYLYSEPWV